MQRLSRKDFLESLIVHLWPKGSVAIISMGQTRQVQTQQGIPLSITAKPVTILDLTIQDRVTSMKVALFF